MTPLVWWAVIPVLLIVSHYSITYKGERHSKIRRMKTSSALFLAAFIVYLVWLLMFSSGDPLLDYSPMAGFVLVAFYPWFAAMRAFEREE